MSQATQTNRYGMNWNRDELVLAFDLYCRIPFAKTKASNPEVARLAASLGRTPASVARKLGNFGSLDPELKKRQISGLGNTSTMDEQIWNEFHSDWGSLVLAAERLRSQFGLEPEPPTEQAKPPRRTPTGPSERYAIRAERIHQTFFRDAILSAYTNKCCITGIPFPECLRAGHIVPWAVGERYRADPTNGLCLSATFERLFDSGLVGIDSGYRVVMSRQLLNSRDEATQRHITCFQGKSITLPTRFVPAHERLDWHMNHVFKE